MKLEDFLAPVPTAPVPFNVDGIDETLYCKIITVEEASSISISPDEQVTPGSGFRFAARLLAKCLVDVDGKPRTDESAWLNVPVSTQKGLTRLVDKIREINGMLGGDEVKDLGNASGATPASDSSSSSA